MNIKLIILILAASVMAGCGTTTTINDPDMAAPVTIESKSDALVMYEANGKKLTVDNRGRPSIFEAILGLVLSNTNAEVK